MEVVVRGSLQNFNGFVNKYPGIEKVSHLEGYIIEPSELKNKILFDFDLDEAPGNMEEYAAVDSLVVIGNIPKSNLAELGFIYGPLECQLYGFNGLPGFFDRDLLEMTSPEGKREELAELCGDLGIKAEIVGDRTGMVTPRVVCMIVNEAYFTVQEGTASRDDIDQAMKLGTNYPYGPFEWKDRIGIRHVYELLEAMYEDTRDERYKICPLLKREYLECVN